MNHALQLFLPCAAGVEGFLSDEVKKITALPETAVHALRAGVLVQGNWHSAMQLNLHSRLAQRVLVQLAYSPYASEDDIYEAASAVAWEQWFTPQHTFKIDITAQRSPLKSLNFAALKVKDAVADRFRAKAGSRPSVDTQWPDVRIYTHLTAEHITLYIDTSGEPLFKRGWREDKGDAPLKETLAAAMIAACGWQPEQGTPLYDPCCGSGTVVIEAAQIACNIAPGSQRHFAFERLLPYQSQAWGQLRQQARASVIRPAEMLLFGSDVAHRMVDFAQRNAERAVVAHAVQLRGGDALQRMPPSATAGILLINPPYGERIAAAGVAGQNAEQRAEQRFGQHSERYSARDNDRFSPRHTGQPAALRPQQQGRESAIVQTGGASDDFFAQLASHWKKNYSGWTAWILSPDLQLSRRMRLKESRRVPMWNGPIECRLMRFDLMAGSMQRPKPDAANAAATPSSASTPPAATSQAPSAKPSAAPAQTQPKAAPTNGAPA